MVHPIKVYFFHRTVNGRRHIEEVNNEENISANPSEKINGNGNGNGKKKVKKKDKNKEKSKEKGHNK